MSTKGDFDWITVEVLSKILRNRCEITGFQLEPATKKGDNYASDMLRCSLTLRDPVDATITKESLILKIIPSGEIQLKVLTKCKIFPREIGAYNDVVTEVEKLLQAAGDQTHISPKCLYTQFTPKQMLVFEDLKAQGYQMVDRRLLLDYEHAALVMQKLGKLHAASTVVQEATPSVMAPFLEGSICDNPDRQDFLDFFHLAGQAVRYQVTKWGREWYKIAEKLNHDFGAAMIQKGRGLYLRDEQAFNVFNHNDVWINNLLYRYKVNGCVEDVLLVDYQLSYWGSPGIDINYFLYGSVLDKVREEHFEDLIEVYYEALELTLKLLRPERSVVSKADILAEVEKKQYLAVNVAFCLMPLNMMSDSEDCSMDLLLQHSQQGEEFRETIFSNPPYLEYLRKRLPALNEMGLLD